MSKQKRKHEPKGHPLEANYPIMTVSVDQVAQYRTLNLYAGDNEVSNCHDTLKGAAVDLLKKQGRVRVFAGASRHAEDELFHIKQRRAKEGFMFHIFVRTLGEPIDATHVLHLFTSDNCLIRDFKLHNNHGRAKLSGRMLRIMTDCTDHCHALDIAKQICDTLFSRAAYDLFEQASKQIEAQPVLQIPPPISSAYALA